MTQMISPREQETLSAYLDNALNPRERQRLETQLQARPELRAALQDLRQTRQLLRSAPALRAPRNFTLTPEMAGLRTKPPRVYPVFRLAFALASILFVLVVGGEMFWGSPAASPAEEVAMAPAAQSFALEAAPMDVMTDTLQTEPGSGERNIAPTEAPAIGGSEPILPVETPTPPLGGYSVAAEPPTPTPVATFKGEPTQEIFEETVPSLEEPMTTTMDIQPPDVALNSASQPVESPSPAPEPSFWASPWRIPQVILGVVILGSAIGLLLFRRKTML